MPLGKLIYSNALRLPPQGVFLFVLCVASLCYLLQWSKGKNYQLTSDKCFDILH